MEFPKLLKVVAWVIILFSIGLAVYGLVNITRARVIVKWSTVNELDTAGFNIFRSEAIGGALTQVNKTLITPSDDPFTGDDYQFVDGNVSIGKTYYYYLDDLDSSGNTTRHGPIEVKATKGGVIELVVSASMFVLGLISLLMVVRESRKSLTINSRLQNDI